MTATVRAVGGSCEGVLVGVRFDANRYSPINPSGTALGPVGIVSGLAVTSNAAWAAPAAQMLSMSLWAACEGGPVWVLSTRCRFGGRCLTTSRSGSVPYRVASTSAFRHPYDD